MPKPNLTTRVVLRWMTALLFLLQISGLLRGAAMVLGGRLDLTALVIAQFDSNIGSSATDPVDDNILMIKPGMTYLRSSGLLGVNLDMGIEVGRFYEDRLLNYENLQVSAGLDYPNVPNSKWNGFLTTSYLENSSANPIAHERLHSEVFSNQVMARYDFLPIYGIGVEAGHSITRSLIARSGTRLSDVEQDTLRSQLFYKYSELLEFKFSYRYRDNQIIGNSADSTSVRDAGKASGKAQVFSVGVNGELTSLLSGRIELGGQRRSLNDGKGGSSSFFSNTNLIWTIRPDATTARIGFLADMTPTPTNDSIHSNVFSLSVDHVFSPFLSGSVRTSYGITDFTLTSSGGGGSPPRDDTAYGVGLGLTYYFNEYLANEFSCNHSWTETNSESGDFDRTNMELSMRLKF